MPAVRAAGSRKITVINGAGTLSFLQAIMFKELKLFEKYDVEANLLNVSDGNKILAGIISGDADICGGSGFNGIFPAIEKGAKVKIIAGANIAPITMLVSAKEDIKSLKDLPGRTVGTGAPGALLHALVVAALKKQGIDYKTVNFVNVGSSTDIFKAAVGGRVDAGVASVEYQDSVGKYKLHIVDGGLFYKEIPQFTNQAMYSSDATIAAKREALTRTMAAFADLFRWIGDQANKDAFLKFYDQAVSGRASDEGVFFQKFLSQPGALATDLVLTEESFKFVQDLNVELGAQKSILPFAQVADMSLARDAIKLVRS
jgi:ABC-type nitrate/sulfonate/bicarbonate transport system substrate-binding protein